MIRKKTVFILGAGASEPFGFPVGSSLRNEIIELFQNKPSGGIYANGKLHSYGSNNKLQIFTESGYTMEGLKNFNSALKNSQMKSIDAFLEYRTEYIPLGKLFISNVLIKYENIKAIRKKPDWYEYIWNKMNAPFQDFHDNKASFITFNYDRSLEIYLTQAMSALYNKSEFDCFEILNKTAPIVHVHGKLGKIEYESEDEYTTFGEPITHHLKLKKTADSIKIVHESIENDAEFTKAKELIMDAEQIIILGLGYNEVNLNRLKLNESKCQIFGSSFDLTSMECASINRKFPSIILSKNYSHKCIDFLRHNTLIE